MWLPPPALVIVQSDVAELTKIIERYIAEEETMRANHLFRQLHEHVVWNHKMTEEQLVAEARNLIDKAHLLDAYSITTIHELISELPGGIEVAESMIEKWIQAFQTPANENFSNENFWNRPLHPQIKDAIDAAKASIQAKTTVFDACYHIATNSG